MFELPQLAHELATLVTLVVAAAWLCVHFVRIGRSSEASAGCPGCGQNPQPALAPGPRGRRSAQLRVLSS